MRFSRRGLLTSGLAAALAPQLARAGPSSLERRFIFVLARGGWDTSMAFVSHDHVTGGDPPSDVTEASFGDLVFMDAESRPSVRAFFERYGDRTCLVNGVEVRSVAHLRCRQLVLTGSSGAGDDWPTQLAAFADTRYMLPNLVLSGPSYALEHVSRVARVGASNQLAELVDGSALTATASMPVASDAEDLVDAFVRERAARFEEAARGTSEARFGQLYEAAMADVQQIKLGDIPNFEAKDNGCARDLGHDLGLAMDAMEADLCRCVMLQHEGVCGNSWDSHDNNDGQQSGHFEDLFALLITAMEDLDGRTASDGTPLRDLVTFVVYSEMGRHPTINIQNGRDHWTYTSALLIGAGIDGGRSIGGIDEYAIGEPVDLATGEISDAGTSLLPEHLGSTLFTLGGLDGEALTGVSPLSAVLA